MEPFVNLSFFNPRIILDIRYATENNFTGIPIYDKPLCFLRLSVAKKLDRIQNKIEKKGIGLKVYDGYRPQSCQKILWNYCSDKKYVKDPNIGSNHNRGAAIDLTLIDLHTQQEWIMPTEFDTFSEKSHRDCFDLPQIAIDNRQFLEDLMVEEEFIPLPTEWWHFDDKNWNQYPLEDLSFDEIQKCHLDNCFT